eukprot:2945112-Rhodomonas_salina.2
MLAIERSGIGCNSSALQSSTLSGTSNHHLIGPHSRVISTTTKHHCGFLQPTLLPAQLDQGHSCPSWPNSSSLVSHKEVLDHTTTPLGPQPGDHGLGCIAHPKAHE